MIAQHCALWCSQPVSATAQFRLVQAIRRSDGQAAQSVLDLVGSTGQLVTLEPVAVCQDQFDVIAHGAMQNFMGRINPRLLEHPDQIREIHDLAW